MKGFAFAVLFVGVACYTNAAPSTDIPIPNVPSRRGTVQGVPTPCTTPKQWEGRFSEWDHVRDANNRYKISFDGVKRRKYVEEEMKSMIPGRRLMKFLILVDEKVEYQIDPSFNQCKKIPMGPWRNFSIPPDATYEDAYQIGGQGAAIGVTEWSDRKPSRAYETWIGGYTDANCWPVFEIFTMTNGSTSIDMTTRFFDITEGIKDMSVFDVPSICSSQATVTPMTTDGADVSWIWGNLKELAQSWVGGWFGPKKIDDGGIKITNRLNTRESRPTSTSY